MPLRQRGSSPMRQKYPPQDNTSRSTVGGLYIDHYPSSSSPSLPPLHDEPQASSLPVFCLEWHTQALKRRRRVLTEAREVRAEMTAGERPGVERLVVVRGTGSRIMETLRGAGGVDGAFLEAHVTRMEFRPSRRRDVGGKWWCWEYPEATQAPRGRSGWRSPDTSAGKTTASGGCWDRDSVTLVRASLWLGPNISILLINRPESDPPAKYEQVQAPPPSLRHRDAATSPRTLQNGTNAGVPPYTNSPSVNTVNVIDHCLSSETGGELETSVWDSIGEGLPYEELVGELVYERWTSFLESLGPRKQPRPFHVAPAAEEAVLWASIKALEQNLDSTRYLERQGRELDSLTYSDWSDLIDRAARRLTLLSATSPPAPEKGRDRDQDDRDANKRALDRISYMGGLLLPLNVVGGIVSMGKPFGPYGNLHWLFWLASLAASGLAVIIIYVDQLRCLPVWIEMAAQDAMLDGHGFYGSESPPPPSPSRKSYHHYHHAHRNAAADWSSVIRDDGGRAWRRQTLGWGGAVKKITGYYRWSGGQGVQFEAPRRYDGYDS